MKNFFNAFGIFAVMLCIAACGDFEEETTNSVVPETRAMGDFEEKEYYLVRW